MTRTLFINTVKYVRDSEIVSVHSNMSFSKLLVEFSRNLFQFPY